MKKYTQADFDAFEVIDGIKQCPSGDYSDIQVFSDRCSFGEDCSFGEECSFEGKGEYIRRLSFPGFCRIRLSDWQQGLLFQPARRHLCPLRLLAVGYSRVPGESEGEECRCDVPGFMRSGREEV